MKKLVIEKLKMKNHLVGLFILSILCLVSIADANWNYRFGDMSGSRFYDSPSSSNAKTDFELEWSVEGNNRILTGNVAGDDNLEIITYGSNYNTVMIYDSEGNLLREIVNAEYTGDNRMFYPTLIADYDGDGLKDIGIGTGSRNYVNLPESRSFFYNSDGDLLAQVDCDEADNKDSWMSPIALLDGKIFVEQHMAYDANPRGLIAYDQADTSLLWHYKMGRPNLFSLGYDSGSLKFVTGGATVHNGGNGCGVNGSATCTTDQDLYTVAIDSNGNEIFTQDYFSNGDSNGSVRSHFIDIDQDGDLEVLSFESHDQTYYHGIGQIHIQDGTTGAYLNTFDASYDTDWRYYAFGDLNNDNQIEIAATSFEPGGYTQYLLDENLNLIASSNMQGRIYCACDIDGSGQADLLIVDGDTLRVTDLQFNEWYSWTAESDIHDVIVSDLDGDSVNEIIIVTLDDILHVLKSVKCEYKMAADLDQNCFVNLVDFAMLAQEWLGSSDPREISSARIAIVNPDNYRVLKGGYCLYKTEGSVYYSMASAVKEDGSYGATTWVEPSEWSGVGTHNDYLGSVLEENGYQVDYYEAGDLPWIEKQDYSVVFVQDPLRTHLMETDKTAMESEIPDLLEYVNSPVFIQKIQDYVNSGGKLVLVGDAVRLLESGSDKLDLGKTITVNSVQNTVTQPDPDKLPDQWLFVRGNPYCGVDRTGSGTYTVESSNLISEGEIISNLTISELSDFPWGETWSDTFYYPADGTSLVDVRIAGTGDYVLRGDICNPPEYTVTVDEVVPNLLGYTTSNGNKIYYIASDSFFDYNNINHHGSWHTGQYGEIDYDVTSFGETMLSEFVNYIRTSD